MASSPASSPANGSMPSSPSELTPRSKVRAMLAALDDDSDGGGNIIPKKPDFITKTGSHDVAEAHQEREASNPLNNIDTANHAEDEEGEVVFKPRGRLAARMLDVRPDTEGDRYREGETDTARDRVKKLLASEANQPSKINLEQGHSGSSGGTEKSIVTRKRKVRRARQTTPDSDPLKNNDVSPGGMFVSPASHKSPKSARDAPSSEDDLPANPTANARFLALVEKKRQERIVREAELHRQKAEKAAELARLSKSHSKLLEDDGVEHSDDDGGRKLTQQSRPTRKASKRALEEMHRETQRMSRNMQLAHEARTKKKITKLDLFARFNYKPSGFVEEEIIEQARPTSSSSAPQTDNETKDTPPTSPISQTSNLGKVADIADDVGNTYRGDVNMSGIDSEEDVPSLKDALSRSMRSSPPPSPCRLDKGKGRAIEEREPLPTDSLVSQTNGSSLDSPLPQVRPPRVALKTALAGNDSDSDLEIIPNKTPIRKTKESVFDRIPAKQAIESHSLQALRMLANVTSPGKQRKGRNAKPSLTATELQMSLKQRARQQAMREREERLQSLRDKGVVVQTAEEREKEIADMEDLVARARREGEEIMKREKEAAKRERKVLGEDVPLGDSSDDEEWEEEEEKFVEQMSSSGSDSDSNGEADASNEEEDEDDDEDAMSADEENSNPSTSKSAHALIDNEASESDIAEEDANVFVQDVEEDFIDDGDEVLDDSHNVDEEPPNIQARRRTKHLVVSDDEDEEDLQIRSSVLPSIQSPLPRNGESPKVPQSVLRSATKTFIPGLTVAGPAGLGLTQIFAGTMDDSQIQALEDSPSTQGQQSCELDTAQDSLAFLRNLPGPEFPVFEPTMNEDSQEIVRDSQTQVTQVPESPLIGADSQAIHLHFSQSQIHGFDSMPQNPSATQFSEFPEPTQDAGFQSISPIKGRFVELPPSTIDTVILQQTPPEDRVDESPIGKKKGRLRRRNEVLVASDEEQEAVSKTPAEETDDFEISENIFDVMRKASKRKKILVDDFDKKKSGAKEMVQEQAEESEDEYAGLGGASDDESGGEEDAYVKAIIDDEGGKDADERQLAAFYAYVISKSEFKLVTDPYGIEIKRGQTMRNRLRSFSRTSQMACFAVKEALITIYPTRMMEARPDDG
jgi:mediator of replication checkpoint protein 1